MFSKELRELDRNTVLLMIDEMQEELNQKRREVEEKKQELTQVDQELTQTRKDYQDALIRIEELESKLKNIL